MNSRSTLTLDERKVRGDAAIMETRRRIADLHEIANDSRRSVREFLRPVAWIPMAAFAGNGKT